MKRLLFVALLYSFGIDTGMSQDYQQLAPGSKVNGQVWYILPKAAITIEIPIVKTTLVPAKSIRQFGARQQGVLELKYGLDPKKYENARQNRELETYAIANDSIRIAQEAVLDYSKIIYISSTSKWNKKQAVNFTYNPDGTLASGESSVENQTFDILVKGASGIASVIGSLFRGDGTNFKAAEDTLKIPELDAIKEKYTFLERQVNFDIYKDLRAERDKEFAKAFGRIFYTEKKTIQKILVKYILKSDTRKNAGIPLFYIDQTGKIIFNEALKEQIDGADISFAIFPDSTKTYQVYFNTEKIEQANLNFQTRSTGSLGIAYNIPLSVKTILYDPAGKELQRKPMRIPQMGTVSNVAFKNGKVVFHLDSLTGELRKIVVEGKSVTSDQVSSVAPAATELITVVKGDDADTKLEKEVKRLENEKKRRELLNELTPD